MALQVSNRCVVLLNTLWESVMINNNNVVSGDC